jgi:hypothetical protein
MTLDRLGFRQANRVQHVVHGTGVLVLRAEEDDRAIADRPHALAG